MPPHPQYLSLYCCWWKKPSWSPGNQRWWAMTPSKYLVQNMTLERSTARPQASKPLAAVASTPPASQQDTCYIGIILRVFLYKVIVCNKESLLFSQCITNNITRESYYPFWISDQPNNMSCSPRSNRICSMMPTYWINRTTIASTSDNQVKYALAARQVTRLILWKSISKWPSWKTTWHGQFEI